MTGKRRVTVEDIAREVGCSIPTVYGCLRSNADRRRNGRYADATIREVRAVADQLGFQKRQPPTVTMEEIGERFGVTHVTVRNALRRTGSVSVELGDRIRAYADRVGYELVEARS